MGVSTRPTHRHHRAKAAFAVSLMVPFCFSGMGFGRTSNTVPFATERKPNSFLPEMIIAAEQVPAGREAVALSAQFTKNSMKAAEDIDWHVKSSSGEEIYAGRNAALELNLSPGSYEVLLNYGNVRLDETVTLSPATRQDVRIILNAGALRVLPRLAKFDGIAPPSETRVIAVGGQDSENQVALSTTPGEMLKLAAGTYRLVSHFANSNAEAVTEIEIKPGVIRSVDIALHAGLAHITLNDPMAVDWKITPDEGEALLATATTFEAVLKPGHYTAETTVSGHRVTSSFTIEDGEEHLVVLPN